MFPMRLKIGSNRNSEWKCCFCLHVRTATMLLGIWHLILHVLALIVLALLMRNHHAMEQKYDNEFPQNDFLPTPLSKIKDDDNPYYLPTTQDGRTIYSSDMDMGAFMTVCTLSITLLMVYGTIKRKATHLLPFFCLQLFDFAITTLTATGYFCYLRSVHRLVDEHWHNLPFRKDLLQLSPQCLSLVVLIAFLVSMLWKAYCIGIVWRCYKYLTLRQQTIRNAIQYILPGEGADRMMDLDYTNMMRDQEAAYCGGMSVLKQTPPPSYQDVMEDQPPPYPATLQIMQENPNRYRVATTDGAVADEEQPEQAAAVVSTTTAVATAASVNSTENNDEKPGETASSSNKTEESN